MPRERCRFFFSSKHRAPPAVRCLITPKSCVTPQLRAEPKGAASAASTKVSRSSMRSSASDPGSGATVRMFGRSGLVLGQRREAYEVITQGREVGVREEVKANLSKPRHVTGNTWVKSPLQPSARLGHPATHHPDHPCRCRVPRLSKGTLTTSTRLGPAFTRERTMPKDLHMTQYAEWCMPALGLLDSLLSRGLPKAKGSRASARRPLALVFAHPAKTSAAAPTPTMYRNLRWSQIWGRHQGCSQWRNASKHWMQSLSPRHLDFAVPTHLLTGRAFRLQVLLILFSTVTAVQCAIFAPDGTNFSAIPWEMLLFVYKPCSFTGPWDHPGGQDGDAKAHLCYRSSSSSPPRSWLHAILNMVLLK